jgi:antitoxin (DNA-binding transcriptional repressor) of toxin-antitoxin stability system
VQIARAGHPLVRLVPIEQDMKPRQGGQLRGKIWIAEDFDEPDPEIEKLFSGEEP